MSSGSYSSSLLNKLGGLAKSTRSKVLGSNDLQTKYSICANKLKALLTSKISAMDEIVLSITSHADLMSDAYIEGQSMPFNQDDFTESAVEISEDVANSIKNSVQYAIEASTSQGADTADKVIHLVDDAGRDVVLAVNNVANDLEDEIEIVIATTKEVEDRTDALIYKEKSTGKIFFNNLVRPSNYIKSSGIIDNLTMNDSLAWLATKYNASISGQDLRTMLRSLCVSKSLVVLEEDTLTDLLARFCSHVGLTDIHNFRELYEYILSISNDLSVPMCVFDLIQSIAQGSTLYTMCSDLIEAFLGGSSTLADLEASVTNYTQKNKGCSEAWLTIKQSFNAGGMIGAIQTIFSFFNESSKQSVVDENRILQFTNNSSLVPQQFIVNVLSTVGELIAQAASAALAVVQPAIGIIASLATGLVTTMIKGLNWRYLETRSSILDDSSVLCDAAPYAAFYRTIDYTPNGYIPMDLINLLTESVPFQLLEVPGGFLLLGFGGVEYDDNYVITHYYIRMEFHPSYNADGVVFFRRMYNTALSKGAIQLTYDAIESPQPHPYQINYIAKWFIANRYDGSYTYSMFVERWTNTLMECLDFNLQDVDLGNMSVNVKSINNQSDGRVSEGDELYILQRTQCNLLMFLLYVGVCAYGKAQVCSFWTTYRHWLNHDETVSNNYWIANSVIYEDARPASIAYYHPSNYNVYDIVDACVNVMICCSSWIPGLDIWRGGYKYIQPINFNFNSWTSQISFATQIRTKNWYPAADLYNPEVDVIINQQLWKDYPIAGRQNFSFGLQLPTLDGETFWRNFAITAVITGLAAGAAVATTILVKKKISIAKYRRAADIDRANDAYKQHPSPETAKAYRKAVKRNNRFTAIFGGTKYGYSDYWNGASDRSEPSSETTGSILSKTSVEASESVDLVTESTTNNLDILYYLLVGKHFDLNS